MSELRPFIAFVNPENLSPDREEERKLQKVYEYIPSPYIKKDKCVIMEREMACFWEEIMNIDNDQRKILREIKENCEKADDCSGCPYEVYDVDLDEHICFFRLAPTFWGDNED